MAKKGTRFGHMQVFNGLVYWLEVRATEAGRGVLMCWDGKQAKEVLPKDYSVATRVHELGGGDFLVTHQGVYFSKADDHSVWLLDTHHHLQAIILHSEDCRYADFNITHDGHYLFCVRERHMPSSEQNKTIEVKNELVRINLTVQEKTTQEKTPTVDIVAEGCDFYSYPRVSPDGQYLCWTCWNQPQMPWDGTELWLADLDKQGQLMQARRIAGSETESIYQPFWKSDGQLHFMSDASGWWNLYAVEEDAKHALTPMAHDFGLPQWILATQMACFDEQQTQIYTAFFEKGVQCLACVETETGSIQRLPVELTDFPGQIHYDKGCLYTIAGSPTHGLGVWMIDLADNRLQKLDINSKETSGTSDLTADGLVAVSKDSISIAEAISFHVSNDEPVHAFYYAPTHVDYRGQDDEKPPLIVMSHGGPTAATSSTFNLGIQFWTSRGFAVVDVNYRGSTGYGREYRQQLNDAWGIADVEDCVYAARYCVDQGKADPERLIIRGGSAGGFTTLCALMQYSDFSAGTTRYGVADLESLVADTHKFEAAYLDKLVGEYPKYKERYQQRSPIYHIDKLSCPLLVLQGLKDKVVPPSQAQTLVQALNKNNVTHAYVEFDNESHGFRKEANIQRALEAELYFYGQVFNIDLADVIEPIEVKRLG